MIPGVSLRREDALIQHHIWKIRGRNSAHWWRGSRSLSSPTETIIHKFSHGIPFLEIPFGNHRSSLSYVLYILQPDTSTELARFPLPIDVRNSIPTDIRFSTLVKLRCNQSLFRSPPATTSTPGQASPSKRHAFDQIQRTITPAMSSITFLRAH
jgi:hypothetical protein